MSAPQSLIISRYALLTGFSILAMAIAAGFAYGYVFDFIYVSNDNVLTYQRLHDNTSLFQWGILAWVVIALLDLLVAFGVYKVYRDTHRNLALTTGLVRAIYAFFLFAAIIKLSALLSADLIGPNGSVNVVSYFSGFERIWQSGLILFGVHLLLLALVGYKSEFTPKPIPLLLLIGGVSYMVVESVNVFLPGVSWRASLESVMSVPMAVSELVFAFWIIYRGFKTR